MSYSPGCERQEGSYSSLCHIQLQIEYLLISCFFVAHRGGGVLYGPLRSKFRSQLLQIFFTRCRHVPGNELADSLAFNRASLRNRVVTYIFSPMLQPCSKVRGTKRLEKGPIMQRLALDNPVVTLQPA